MKGSIKIMEHSKIKLAAFSLFNLSDMMISQIYQILKDRLGDKFSLRLLFRGTRDGFTSAKFHELCDDQGPLLTLVKTGKDKLIGGFSSIHWKNSGEWTVDHKCVVFSLTPLKTY